MCYKALLLLEHLIKHGPGKIVGDVQSSAGVLDRLQHFQYKDANLKDHGAPPPQLSMPRAASVFRAPQQALAGGCCRPPSAAATLMQRRLGACQGPCIARGMQHHRSGMLLGLAGKSALPCSRLPSRCARALRQGARPPCRPPPRGVQASTCGTAPRRSCSSLTRPSGCGRSATRCGAAPAGTAPSLPTGNARRCRRAHCPPRAGLQVHGGTPRRALSSPPPPPPAAAAACRPSLAVHCPCPPLPSPALPCPRQAKANRAKYRGVSADQMRSGLSGGSSFGRSGSDRYTAGKLGGALQARACAVEGPATGGHSGWREFALHASL